MSSPSAARFTLRHKPLTEHSHFVCLLKHLSYLGTSVREITGHKLSHLVGHDLTPFKTYSINSHEHKSMHLELQTGLFRTEFPLFPTGSHYLVLRSSYSLERTYWKWNLWVFVRWRRPFLSDGSATRSSNFFSPISSSLLPPPKKKPPLKKSRSKSSFLSPTKQNNKVTSKGIQNCEVNLMRRLPQRLETQETNSDKKWRYWSFHVDWE